MFKNFNILLKLNCRYWKIQGMPVIPVLSQTSEGVSVQDGAEASREKTIENVCIYFDEI